MTAATVRELALALPATVESSHFDVADFRVGTRIFATIHPNGKTGVLLRLDPDLVAALCDAEPQAFERRGTALQVVFARVDRARYADLLEQAWRAIAPKRLDLPGRRG